MNLPIALNGKNHEKKKMSRYKRNRKYILNEITIEYTKKKKYNIKYKRWVYYFWRKKLKFNERKNKTKWMKFAKSLEFKRPTKISWIQISHQVYFMIIRFTITYKHFKRVNTKFTMAFATNESENART